jgi:hypothetical protein
MRTSSALLAIAAVVAAGLAHAQVLYKWTDAQGKVQYSDQPPKNFDGPVTRIEPDTPATPWFPPAASAATPKAPSATPGHDGMMELATRKRESREALRANIERAQARVDAARKALDEAKATPDEGERQVIQQRVATSGNFGTAQNVPNTDVPRSRATAGGMHGMAVRTNCRSATGADGKTATVCPTTVLRPEYFERIEKLEEALRVAEEDLAAAQRLYARNVD